MENPSNPFYREPDHHSYLRRASHHDYTRPARYMITLHKSPNIPALSAITGNLSISNRNHPESPQAVPSLTGACFYQALSLWCTQYPQMRIDALTVMPDHIHFCLTVTAALPGGLSRAIAGLMGKTSSLYSHEHQAQNYDSSSKPLRPFFAKGFNDRIAYTDEQYQAQCEYISDNPRRLLMKRLHPDLYLKNWIIKSGDIQLMAKGNIYLLKNPHLQVIRFSRKFDSAQLADKERCYRECLRNNGAFISPFIHPHEKKIRDEVISNDGNIIRICENGFSERFYPSKSEFDLMGTNRLLLIAPIEHNYHRQEMKYAYAQQLNHIAEILASHPADLRITAAQ